MKSEDKKTSFMDLVVEQLRKNEPSALNWTTTARVTLYAQLKDVNFSALLKEVSSKETALEAKLKELESYEYLPTEQFKLSVEKDMKDLRNNLRQSAHDLKATMVRYMQVSMSWSYDPSQEESEVQKQWLPDKSISSFICKAVSEELGLEESQVNLAFTEKQQKDNSIKPEDRFFGIIHALASDIKKRVDLLVKAEEEQKKKEEALAAKKLAEEKAKEAAASSSTGATKAVPRVGSRAVQKPVENDGLDDLFGPSSTGLSKDKSVRGQTTTPTTSPLAASSSVTSAASKPKIDRDAMKEERMARLAALKEKRAAMGK
eukprot:TRINITY_DN7741_c0_g1_i6.p1 TRINITY_DN7741_c0_g1~~TRINITY_DN7741_c0_g1_i6.p1  ORF type:complete len:340 (-),score=111.13 TRINITY_DN7741_c0_g1_i6:134-1084(-)